MHVQEAKKKAKKGRGKADEGAAKKGAAPKKKGRVRSSSLSLRRGVAGNETPCQLCQSRHMYST